MGACLSLCGGKKDGPDAEIYRQGARSNLPDTEADRQARIAAAEAAAQRQTRWEQSAVGKATVKAAKAAQEKPQGRAGTDTSRDWLN